MKKRSGFEPFVLFTLPIEPDPTFVVPGSGQGGRDPFPMSFDAWITSGFQKDYTGEGDIDYNDFLQWWIACQFTEEQWNTIYPDDPYPFGNDGNEP